MTTKQKTMEYVWNIYFKLRYQSNENYCRVKRWRKTVLILTVLSAILGAIGGYLQRISITKYSPIDAIVCADCIKEWLIFYFNLTNTFSLQKTIGGVFGIIGTILMSVVAYYASRMISSKKDENWRAIRSISAAYFSKIILFATQKGEYSALPEGKQIVKMLQYTDEYLKQLPDIVLPRIPSDKNEMPQAIMSINDYINNRIIKQQQYYEDMALFFDKKVKLFERFTLSLGIGSVVISGVAVYFDASILITLLTAISSAYSTYSISQKYREQMQSYNAALNQLSILLRKYELSQEINEDEFVIESEKIINAESSAWMNIWV